MDANTEQSQERMKFFVQQWIKIRPMSQEDIARATGIPQVQLSRFEHLNLKQDVMEQYQQKICNHFKVSVEEVINGKTHLKKRRRSRIRYTETMKRTLINFIKNHEDISIPEYKQKCIAQSLGISLNNVKYFISNHRQNEKKRCNQKLPIKRIEGIKESTLKQLARDLKLKKEDPKLSFKIKEFISNFVPWEDKFDVNHT